MSVEVSLIDHGIRLHLDNYDFCLQGRAGQRGHAGMPGQPVRR